MSASSNRSESLTIDNSFSNTHIPSVGGKPSPCGAQGCATPPSPGLRPGALRLPPFRGKRALFTAGTGKTTTGDPEPALNSLPHTLRYRLPCRAPAPGEDLSREWFYQSRPQSHVCDSLFPKDRGVPEDPGAGGLLSAGEEAGGRGTSHIPAITPPLFCGKRAPLTSGTAISHLSTTLFCGKRVLITAGTGKTATGDPQTAVNSLPHIVCYRLEKRAPAPGEDLSREWFYQSRP